MCAPTVNAIKDVGHLSVLNVAVGGGRRFLWTTPVLTRAQVGRVPIPPIMRAVRLLVDKANNRQICRLRVLSNRDS